MPKKKKAGKKRGIPFRKIPLKRRGSARTKARPQVPPSLRKKSPRKIFLPRFEPTRGHLRGSVHSALTREAPLRPVQIPGISLTRKMEEEVGRHLAHPRVSVVIVNRDGVDSLWHCLFALKTQTYQPEQIILVDNGSKDASLDFVKSNYPQVQILECPEDFGPALGGNLGAKCATGDLVIFLSNDAVPTPDWLSRLVEDFRRDWPKVGALDSFLQSRRGEEDPPSKNKTLNFLGNQVEGFFGEDRVAFYPESGSLLYARFLAPEGPFDEDYYALREDMYLGWKLRLLGRSIFHSPGAKAYRREETTLPRFPAWKTAYYSTRNRWLNLMLFYGTGNLLKVLPWMVLEAFTRLAKGLATGLHGFLGTLLAVTWILTHPATIRRKRQALQEKRKVTDREVLRYMSGRIVPDKGRLARVLNFFSLLYCLATGLEVMEFQGDNDESGGWARDPIVR